MKMTETFEVSQSPDRVWDLFQDVPSLSRCLPGAELTADLGNGEYEGQVGVKLGPMTANFEGKATVIADAATRSGTITGKGTDKRGGSVGQVKIDYSINAADDGGTQVTVDGDVQLSGAAAQFGRTGLIKSMSEKLIGEFVACIEAQLSAETDEEATEVRAAEVKGISLLFSSLWAIVVRFVKRLVGRSDADSHDAG